VKTNANKGCILLALGKYDVTIDFVNEAEKIDVHIKTDNNIQKCKQEAFAKSKKCPLSNESIDTMISNHHINNFYKFVRNFPKKASLNLY
jgi:hypothetical protein